MRRIALVTGAAGFIGSHLIEHLLKETDWTVVGLDRLDETSTLARLDNDAYRLNRDRVRFVWHDLKAPINPYVAAQIGPVHVAYHLAASTHVDRSITHPLSFVMDNVVGTANLLIEMKRRPGSRVFVFSTDEVTGPAPPGVWFPEDVPLNSRNPYSASKAGAEELARAFANTYGMDVIITRAMNAIGERQHVEKFVPKVILSVLAGALVPIHSDPEGVPGSRTYVHARNLAAALVFLTEKGKSGEVYNLGGEKEMNNLAMAAQIAKIINKPLRYELEGQPSERPGHDLRYALDMTKLWALGFTYPKSFDESLEKTVKWYLHNQSWLGL